MAKTSLHTHTAVARLPGVSYRLSCLIAPKKCRATSGHTCKQTSCYIVDQDRRPLLQSHQTATTFVSYLSTLAI